MNIDERTLKLSKAVCMQLERDIEAMENASNAPVCREQIGKVKIKRGDTFTVSGVPSGVETIGQLFGLDGA